MKIAIVGSRKYENKIKIKEFIFKCKEQFGDKLEIVSGGCKYGADKFAKQSTVELDLKYVEFPPSHYNWNMHCKLPATQYNKPYYVSNYFKRNKQIAEYCHMVIGFIPDGSDSRGTSHTIGEAQIQKKMTQIIN